MRTLVAGALNSRHQGDPEKDKEEMIEIDEDLFKDIVATPWISSKVAFMIFLERKGKAMSFLKIKSKPR